VIPVFSSLAPAVCSAILSIIVSTAQGMAENLAAQDVFDRFSRAFARRGLDREIREALLRAFQRFADDVTDPDLVASLAQARQLQTDPAVVRVLAEAATQPLDEQRQAQELAKRMHDLVPHLSWTRCEHAAQVLLAAVHTEAARIDRLQTGLLYLLGLQLQRTLERSEVPVYDDGLREALVGAADQVQQELGHHHITSAHLLYAVVVVPGAVARAVLAQQGVLPVDIKEALKRCIKPYAGASASSLTAGANGVLLDAQQVARRRGADRTRGEHVLEALVEQVLRGTHHSSTAAVFQVLHLSANQLQADVVKAGQVESQLESALESFEE
jgi:ClpA/ClpB-like protein